ncbi:MAG TPA: AP2 domain-containing protein [Tepidisphaeraceae bacterium]|nr:AP2 domain-containing protein [Tepidisphaeraceae bacterium]
MFEATEQAPGGQGQADAPAGTDAGAWVDQREARQILDVRVGMFEYWMRHGQITTGRWAPKPGGGKHRLYARAEIERVAETARDRRRRHDAGELPPGHAGRDEAARRAGVSPKTWKNWVRERRVPPGTIILDLRGGRRGVYTEGELRAILESLRAIDPTRPYRDGERPGAYVYPDGLVGREQAWTMFGVTQPTWERWERQGLITCGQMLFVAGGGRLKAYPLAELKRVLAPAGRFAPPYPDPERTGCVRVPLTGHGIHRREALIDAADLPLIEAGTCSCAVARPGGAGRVGRTDPHVAFHAPDAKMVPLRRLITGVSGRNRQVGHLNGDTLDCRRANLVVRTVAQRSYTTRKREVVAGRPTTSRFKGVCWEKWTGRWVAQIRHDGVNRRIGRFHDEVAAAEAYDGAARELFGEHARLNFPDGADARPAAESGGPAQGAQAAEPDSRAAA